MFCTSCGANVQPGEVFCLRCGARLKHVAAGSAAGDDGTRGTAEWRESQPYVVNVADLQNRPEEKSFSEQVRERLERIRVQNEQRKQARQQNLSDEKTESGEYIGGHAHAAAAAGSSAGSSRPASGRARSSAASRKHARRSGSWLRAAIMTLLLLVVGAIIVYIGLSGMGRIAPDSADKLMLSACGGGTEPQGVIITSTDLVSSTDAVTTAATTADTLTTAQTANDVFATTTVSATTASTTTTTARTTRTTAATSAKKAEAERIRGLLTAKTWTTTIDGYDATIKFSKDGTAKITVKVKEAFFTVTEEVDATYVVTDDCKAVIEATYNGMELGISGAITAKSDTELVVERDGGKGTVVLKAKK